MNVLVHVGPAERGSLCSRGMPSNAPTRNMHAAVLRVAAFEDSGQLTAWLSDLSAETGLSPVEIVTLVRSGMISHAQLGRCDMPRIDPLRVEASAVHVNPSLGVQAGPGGRTALAVWHRLTMPAELPGGARRAPAGRGRASSTPAFDVTSFARAVQAAAADPKVKRWGDRKVYISAIWRAIGSRLGLRLPDFKRRLVEANRMGLVRLARGDLVAAMDRRELASSETTHLNATFHFVEAEPRLEVSRPGRPVKAGKLGRAHQCGPYRHECGTFLCPGCNRLMPWCWGAGDDQPDLCDECAMG